jgi:hypothetical protein
MTTLANPRCRHAPRTSSPQCVSSMKNSLMNTFHRTLKRLDGRRLIEVLNSFHHQRRKTPHPKSLIELLNTIQYP